MNVERGTPNLIFRASEPPSGRLDRVAARVLREGLPGSGHTHIRAAFPTIERPHGKRTVAGIIPGRPPEWDYSSSTAYGDLTSPAA